MKKFKEFWYHNIEDFLEKSDAYDNPKTVKIYEIATVEQIGKKLFRAVTYLRTSIIGFQVVVDSAAVEDLAKKCEAHGLKQGVVLEIGRLE